MLHIPKKDCFLFVNKSYIVFMLQNTELSLKTARNFTKQWKFELTYFLFALFKLSVVSRYKSLFFIYKNSFLW